jgi:ABC-type bacteriocin/lantibiotic exporter with double-glycine peptidase domain
MKHIHKTFTRQLDQTDCGVACLLSILHYYSGDATRERLRESSGTSVQGTSLLGLFQTAQALGFTAEGLEAEGVHNLSELTGPAILHVVLDNRLQHYVVYYQQEGDKYILNVPMLVYPLNSRWDQPGNAARVMAHGKGQVGNLQKVNAVDRTKQIVECLAMTVHQTIPKL